MSLDERLQKLGEMLAQIWNGLQAQLENARAEMKGLIQGWLASSSTASKPATKPPAQLPQLDPDEIAKLPWKTYRTKTDCEPDEAGWIFRDTKGAEDLAHLIETQGKDVLVQIALTSLT